MPNDIDQFVGWIINQRPETSKIPDPEKAIMQKNLQAKLEHMVNLALVAKMTPKQIEEFDQILERDSDVEISNFVETTVPDAQKVVSDVLTDFAKMYLGEGNGRNATTS